AGHARAYAHANRASGLEREALRSHIELHRRGALVHDLHVHPEGQGTEREIAQEEFLLAAPLPTTCAVEGERRRTRADLGRRRAPDVDEADALPCHAVVRP